jgi:hypothetical protein
VQQLAQQFVTFQPRTADHRDLLLGFNDMLQALRRSRALRDRAERDRAEARAATADAASVLVDDLDLGLRDVAELLGVSHQRVQQLVRA